MKGLIRTHTEKGVPRKALNMKATAELRAKIEAGAAKSGRSLSAEVEYRLERSYRDDDVVAAVLARMPKQVPQAAGGEVKPANNDGRISEEFVSYMHGLRNG